MPYYPTIASELEEGILIEVPSEDVASLVKTDCEVLRIDPKPIQLRYIRNLRRQAQLMREIADKQEAEANRIEASL